MLSSLGVLLPLALGFEREFVYILYSMYSQLLYQDKDQRKLFTQNNVKAKLLGCDYCGCAVTSSMKKPGAVSRSCCKFSKIFSEERSCSIEFPTEIFDSTSFVEWQVPLCFFLVWKPRVNNYVKHLGSRLLWVLVLYRFLLCLLCYLQKR